MTRILSALVLLPIVLGIIWWLPPGGTLVLAMAVAGFAYAEYAAVVSRIGVSVWRVVGVSITLALCAALGSSQPGVELVLLGAVVMCGVLAVAAGQPDRELLPAIGATFFGAAYIGLPLGALAAIHARWGPLVVFVALGAVVVSDTAQYYTGRLLGRHALAAAISPKKTVEGALGGVVAAAVAVPLMGQWGLPGRPPAVLAGLGVIIAIVGIVGDLFESQIKRAAGVKDASHLIPGHGGVLDRVDALLFAAPVFYLFLRVWP